jgi:elongation factor P hydroxylase
MNVAVGELAVAGSDFSALRLERVFDRCFAREFHTRLIGGAAEPFYQPAKHPGKFHTLWYREDFFASALHEVAHWCIAGEARRRLPDFGYWYAPDGRDEAQQAAFEAVEDKPQALEWFFSLACGYRFRLSADNLDGDDGRLAESGLFRRRVCGRALHWQLQGLPERAARFFFALSEEFDNPLAITELLFREELLR